MPTVIGIDQVPREIVRPKWYEDLGYGFGNFQRETFDKLMEAFLQQQMQGGGFGRVPTSPTPQNPGSLSFPSGATTPTSPLEMAQIRQMGGVPTTTSQVMPLQPGGVTYQQPTRLGFLPNLNRQSQEAELELKRQQAAYYQTLSNLGQPQAPTPSSVPPSRLSPSAPSITSPILQWLFENSNLGDTKSLDAIRYLALKKDDPEAIALLQSLGEL